MGDILRTSRLALLFGAAGSDKTALLKNGLMPLLHRRATDRITAPAARETGVVVPFPDRRRRSSARASKRRLELIVYFDNWTDTPLAALQACIHKAAGKRPATPAEAPLRLSETLANLSSRLDASFIILLDRFEEFLQAPDHREDIAQFANELIEAVNQARLPANFLLALNEEARPQLARLRSRIPGFDDFSLKLPHPPGFRPTLLPAQVPELPDAVVIKILPTLNEAVTLPAEGPTAPAETALATAVTRTTVRPKVKLPLPPRVPVTTEEVYAFIEATLAHTTTKVAPSPSPADSARADGGRVHAPAGLGASLSDAVEAHPRATALAPAGLPGSLPSVRKLGVTLGAAVDWLARHLRRKTEPGA